VLGEILPEARVEDLPGLIEAERRFGVGADGLRRLAAMLREGAEGVAARFRVSSAQKKRLVLASRRLVAQDDAGWRALAYRHGAEAAGDWALMAGVAPLSGWTRPVFGVKGRDIVARGVAAWPWRTDGSPRIFPMRGGWPSCWMKQWPRWRAKHEFGPA